MLGTEEIEKMSTADHEEKYSEFNSIIEKQAVLLDDHGFTWEAKDLRKELKVILK